MLYFLRHGALTVATTHFSELKAFAHTTTGLQNASLDFDVVSLAPTYHLTVGVPGGSNALAAASRFGLPEEIINEATGMLTRGSQELETLLSDLAAEKQNLQSLRIIVERENNEAAQKNSELEKELAKLKADERRIINELRDKIVQESSELFRDMRQAAADLKKEISKEKIEAARKALAAAQENLKNSTLTPPAGEIAEEEKVKPGDTVWLREGNVPATVISISDEIRQAELLIGQATLKVSIDIFYKIASPVKQVSVPYTVTAPKQKVSNEIDLRGKRADEIKELVNAYLDDAAIAGLGRVRIIHGHGTGVVKQIAREILASHSLVKSWRPGEQGEGGDGVTIANLR